MPFTGIGEVRRSAPKSKDSHTGSTTSSTCVGIRYESKTNGVISKHVLDRATICTEKGLRVILEIPHNLDAEYLDIISAAESCSADVMLLPPDSAATDAEWVNYCRRLMSYMGQFLARRNVAIVIHPITEHLNHIYDEVINDSPMAASLNPYLLEKYANVVPEAWKHVIMDELREVIDESFWGVVSFKRKALPYGQRILELLQPHANAPC